MAEFVQDCPRCGAKSITFDIGGDFGGKDLGGIISTEALCCCRNCGQSSIARLYMPGRAHSGQSYTSGTMSQYPGNVIHYWNFERFVSVADQATIDIPEFVPGNVEQCFREGAAAFAIGAYNAAAAMFRLSLDLATKDKLPTQPAEEGGPNAKQRKNLFDRLDYLFGKNILPNDLRELADCIREDGNDGAHDGTLTKADAEDLIDFAEALLERVYTEPARLELAKARRIERRSGGSSA